METEEVALAVARAEAGGGPATIEYNVTRFVRVLRHLGVRVSLAETVDAMTALAGIDLLDGGQVRGVLRACLAKGRKETVIFNQAFDLFFATPEAKAERRQRYREREAQRERRRNEAERELQEVAKKADLSFTDRQLRTFSLLPSAEKKRLGDVFQQMKANGINDAGRLINMVLQSSLNYWRYYMMKNKMDRGEDLSGLEAELTGDPDLDGVIRGVTVGFYHHPEDRILHSDLEALDEADLPRVTALINRMAARLDLSISRRYKRSSRAVAVDIRRTMRRNTQYGGLPLELRYRARRRKRPRIVLICDVSASMARYARFVLQFIHGLNAGLRGIESFVFSEDLEGATGYFRRNRDFTSGLAELMNGSRQWGKTTNLHKSLQTFRSLYRDTLTRDTVVFIVSDGKTVAPEGAAALLEETGRQCADLIWLNTLPQREWEGVAALRLLGTVVDMYECNTLAQLTECLRRHIYRGA